MRIPQNGAETPATLGFATVMRKQVRAPGNVRALFCGRDIQLRASLFAMQQEASEDKPRRPIAWVTPAVTAALIILGPPLAHTAVGGWILAGLLVIAFVGALIDAHLHRPNLTFAVIVGVAYFIAMRMYFDEGTWIYLPVLVVLALVGSHLPLGRARKAA